MRHQRLKQRWTQQQMAETIGIPRSTLAKVERDRLTLTYDKLRQVTLRLRISMGEFLGQPASPTTTPHKRMVPLVVTLRAHAPAELGEPLARTGEEFVFVLAGSIEVQMQCYTPVTLTTGQGIYLDSSMPHAYVAKNCASAVMLAVCSSPDPNLMDRLSGIPLPRPQSRARKPAPQMRAAPVCRILCAPLKTNGSGRK